MGLSPFWDTGPSPSSLELTRRSRVVFQGPEELQLGSLGLPPILLRPVENKKAGTLHQACAEPRRLSHRHKNLLSREAPRPTVWIGAQVFANLPPRVTQIRSSQD